MFSGCQTKLESSGQGNQKNVQRQQQRRYQKHDMIRCGIAPCHSISPCEPPLPTFRKQSQNPPFPFLRCSRRGSTIHSPVDIPTTTLTLLLLSPSAPPTTTPSRGGLFLLPVTSEHSRPVKHQQYQQLRSQRSSFRRKGQGPQGRLGAASSKGARGLVSPKRKKKVVCLCRGELVWQQTFELLSRSLMHHVLQSCGSQRRRRGGVDQRH